MPMTSTFFPATSDGRSVRRWPHPPSRTQRSDFFVRREAASSMYIACSATDTELAVPVVISGILRLLSAGTSTASKPTPRRATTIMPGAASSSAWRNGVAPKVTAWASFSLGCSEGGLSSVRISKSTSSRFFSTSRPACGMRPTISTFLRFLPVVIVSPAVCWAILEPRNR